MYCLSFLDVYGIMCHFYKTFCLCYLQIGKKGNVGGLFLGFKYRRNLLPFCSKLLSFQGKFNFINIAVVIKSKMAVNYCSICFITLAPGAYLSPGNVLQLDRLLLPYYQTRTGKTRLERLARDKHSSLFGTKVSYKEKSCITLFLDQRHINMSDVLGPV